MADGPIQTTELPEIFTDFAGLRNIVLAVSGGSDSTALMVLARRWRDLGHDTGFTVVSVDHGLRAESTVECDVVMAQAGALGLPGLVKRWLGDKPVARIQERARNARYDLLIAAAVEIGAEAIVTAHTLEDQAETVLMRLGRGSALDGLGAMRPRKRRGGILHLRPLLGIVKARLTATLEEAGIGWIEDPSNQNSRYERVRVRALLAELAPLGLDAVRLAALAARAQRGTDALDWIAENLFFLAARDIDDAITLDAALYAAQPAELRLRLLNRAIHHIAPPEPDGYGLRLERLEALGTALDAALLAGEKRWRQSLGGTLVSLDSPGTVTIRREAERRRGRSSPKSQM